LSSISECKNNGECVINKKNRTACKACRLRKCLLVGMSKSGSRYGRRSNWFKIHCLLQEQQQHQQQQQYQQKSMSNSAPNSPTMMSKGFLPSHFLSTFTRKVDNNDIIQREHKRHSSSSDSSASSADLDLNNGKEIQRENLEIRAIVSDVREVPIKKFCPGIEPLSPYLPTKCHSEPLFSLPLIFPSIIHTSNKKLIDQAEEPMDLSIRTKPVIQTIAKSPSKSDVPKTIPLDLTLVRGTNFSELIS
jgi:hypothetical protein